MIKIVFMGSPGFAVPALTSLLDDPVFQVTGVFSMPDKPKGRGQKESVTPVKALATNRKIPVFTPASFRKDPSQIEILRDLKPDFLAVVAYGLILPKEVLEIPRLASVNLHASLLPKYRGPSPIHFALLNGEEKTGNTVMLMNEKMDEGDILSTEEIPISDADNLETLHDRLSSTGAVLLRETLKSFSEGEIHPVPQNHSLATYTTKIKPDLAKIDWEKEARAITNLVRAMSPFPGAWFELKGERIKIGSAVPGDASGKPCGEVFQIDDKTGINVACGNNTSLQIKTLQRPGKSMLPAADFLRGYKEIGIGTRLSQKE